MCYIQDYQEDGRYIDIGSSAKNKMAAIQLLKIYDMDTPCERDIFRIVSPIDLKFDL